jgi:methionyl-tRNA synthetase
LSEKYYYITTPIYYVNAKPHIGTAYTTVAADTLARFMRLDGYQVHFLTGTDEHGQKVQKSAEDQGIPPQNFVDTMSENFRKLSKAFHFTENDFIRTTEPRHQKGAQHLWNTLVEKGHIYEDIYAGWYALRDEAFYHESELMDGLAPTGAPVEWVEESCYFFRLSAFQEELLAFYENHSQFILPLSRRNEVISFVQRGLKDLCVSRSTFTWGIPVPGNPGHVMYVWIDALANYITALGYPESTDDMKNFWPQAIHLVGKDILRFHCVYWPAFLMAVGLPLPQRIFAHGWWTNEGQKISKSLGNVIDPFEVVEEYGVDSIRYFMIREIPFGQDGDFSKSQLIQRMNTDLANSLGNLVQRVLSFINKNTQGKIPSPGIFEREDIHLQSLASQTYIHMQEQAQQQSLHKMTETLWQFIGECNRYVDQMAPWVLRKTDEKRMNTVLYNLVESIRHIGILAQPIIPLGASSILDQLAITPENRNFRNLGDPIIAGTLLPPPQVIFPKFHEKS